MIVMQFLATDQQAPGHNIAARIRNLVVSIAEIMTEPINHAGCPERYPDQLHSVNDRAGERSKNDQVNR